MTSSCVVVSKDIRDGWMIPKLLSLTLVSNKENHVSENVQSFRKIHSVYKKVLQLNDAIGTLVGEEEKMTEICSRNKRYFHLITK